MVVISAAVVTKQGKVVLARQFVEISRPRIEGLLSAFPKLLGKDDGENGEDKKREHTFIETPSVRYVYQPMEDLYMLIITNKSSNILEDLDALHLLAKIVGDYCRRIGQEEVLEVAFDLIFAFDECFALGYKEKLTMRQIEENLEMDSHNERLHDIMQRDRERDAEIQAEDFAAMREMERREAQRLGRDPPRSGYQGNRSGGYVPSVTSNSRNQESISEGWGEPKSTKKESSRGRGMKLGNIQSSSNQEDAFLRQLAKEDKSVKVVSSGKGSEILEEKETENTDPVTFFFTETVSAVMDKEAEIFSVNIKGELNVYVTDPEAQIFKAKLTPCQNAGFSFNTHPAVHKKAFKSNVLTLKDAESQPFPLRRKEAVIKWRSKGEKNSDLVPFTVSCWPSAGGKDKTIVNLEYELLKTDTVLKDVTITIPIPSAVTPVVEKCEGTYKFNAHSKTLEWKIAMIDEDNGEGSMVLLITNSKGDNGLFPIEIDFSSSKTLCPLSILQVDIQSKQNINFTNDITSVSEKYTVVEEEY